MSKELEPYQQIERNIQKKFRKTIWNPFIVAVKRYELIAPGDKIATCISGGKDSMLMASFCSSFGATARRRLSLLFGLWIRDTMKSTAKRSKAMPNRFISRLRFLKPMFLP